MPMRRPHEDPSPDQAEAPAGEAVHEAPPLGNAGDEASPEAEPEAPPPAIKLTAILESLLFAADRPLTLDRLRELVPGQDPAALREALSALEQDYVAGGRGIQ